MAPLKKDNRKRKKPTVEALLKVLAAKGGNLSETAKAFKVNRRSVYHWLNSSEAYKSAYEDQQESMIDFAESKLMQSINNGSDTATIFFLKTRAKSRGYVEKSEVDHTTKGESINKEVEKLTDEELLERIEKLRKKMK
jgi:hypothetical protein